MVNFRCIDKLQAVDSKCWWNPSRGFPASQCSPLLYLTIFISVLPPSEDLISMLTIPKKHQRSVSPEYLAIRCLVGRWSVSLVLWLCCHKLRWFVAEVAPSPTWLGLWSSPRCSDLSGPCFAARDGSRDGNPAVLRTSFSHCALWRHLAGQWRSWDRCIWGKNWAVPEYDFEPDGVNVDFWAFWPNLQVMLFGRCSLSAMMLLIIIFLLLIVIFLLFVSFRKGFCLCFSILIVNTNASLTGLLKKPCFRLNVKAADMTFWSYDFSCWNILSGAVGTVQEQEVVLQICWTI